MSETVLFLVLAGIGGWIVYYLWPERVVVADGKLIKRHRLRTTNELSLAELAEIKFHYHAVVGFVGAWEFVSVSGRSFTVGARSNAMPKALVALEGVLPNFSVEDFNRKFREGDVED